MDFSLVDNTLPTCSQPVWLKLAQCPLNGTPQPKNIEEEGLRPAAMDKLWLNKKKCIHIDHLY